MAINSKALDIMKVAQLSGRSSVRAIASAAKLKEHVVTYYLQRLRSADILRSRVLLNLSLLGLQYYEICFAFGSHVTSVKNAFLKALHASPHVMWLGSLGGDFQYAFTALARSSTHLARVLSDLESTLPHLFAQKAIALRLSFIYFGNRYISNKKPIQPNLQYSVSEEGLKLDSLDSKILYMLATGFEPNSLALSRKLGAAQTTIAYKLKQLEQSGIIVGYYYEVASATFSMQSLLLLISTKGFSTTIKERLFAFCQRNPHIVILTHCLGAWDFEIGIDVPLHEPRFIQTVLDELEEQFGENLNWIKVLPMFEHLKVQDYLDPAQSANHRNETDK